MSPGHPQRVTTVTVAKGDVVDGVPRLPIAGKPQFLLQVAGDFNIRRFGPTIVVEVDRASPLQDVAAILGRLVTCTVVCPIGGLRSHGGLPGYRMEIRAFDRAARPG